MMNHSFPLPDSVQASLSSRGILILDAFLFWGFFNHWVSGADFPRHFNVVSEKLLLTSCQIFPA